MTANLSRSALPPSHLVSDRFHLPNICTVQSLLFVVLAGTLLSVVFAVANSGLRHFDWQAFLLTALFVLWVALVTVAALCQMRPWLARRALMAGSLFSYVLVLSVTLVLSMLAQWILTRFFNQLEGFDWWRVAEHVLIAAILGGVSLRYLYLQEQLHIQQQAELSSRIQALQSRIRPHFLFNSMNIIASLIESDPQLAEKVVEDLSVLFRATLSSASQLVPLQQELELGKNYLHIESLRLGERLRVEWQVAEHLLSVNPPVLLPHLSLQPLLENAVYHGIQPLVTGGTITIAVRERSDALEVTVRNPVSPPGQDAALAPAKRGNSLALENLEHRLQAYYGEGASFRAGLTPDQHFEVSFACPLRPPAPQRA